MTAADDAALFDAVTEMVGEAKQLRSELTTVARAGRRNRRTIWLVAASVMLDVLLSIALGWSIHKTNETADRTDAVASTKGDVCTAFNDQNKVSRVLWEEFFAQAPLGAQTPEEKLKRQADLREAVAVAFAPVRCELE